MLKKLWKAITSPVHMSEVDEIDGKEYFIRFSASMGGIGVFTIFASWLFVFLGSQDTGMQMMVLIVSTFLVLMGTILISKKFLVWSLGRMKSIDPEFPGGWMWSILFYPALSSIVFAFYLFIAKPKSQIGQLYKKMKWAWRMMAVGILVIFITTYFVFGASETSQKIVKKTSYWMLGPAVYYVVGLVGNTQKALAFSNVAKDLSFEAFLEEGQGQCSQYGTSHILLIITSMSRVPKFNKEQKDDLNLFLKEWSGFLEIVDACGDQPPFPVNFNPFWAFNSTTATEGAMMVLVDHTMNLLFFVGLASMLEKKQTEFSKKGVSEEMVRKFDKRLKETRHYKRMEQLRRYPPLYNFLVWLQGKL